MRFRTRCALLAGSVLLCSVTASAQTPGWSRLDLGSGHYAERYLPTSVRPCDALPLMLFLHGAGGTPEQYETYLQPDAETLGLVLVLPAASGTGWSSADIPTISSALDAIGAELNVDGTRTYFAGHSAGAAFAYLTAYEASTGVAAVFTLAAPYYQVTSLAEPTYRAPIHMYYGADDPNYTGGAAMANASMWMSLGIPWEQDVQTGYGHSTWPAASMRAGMQFLLAHSYPGTPPTSRCPGTDAGADVVAADVGTDAAQSDAHGAGDASDSGGSRDAARDASRDGGASGALGGCGCQIESSGSKHGSISLWALFAGITAALGARKRRIPGHHGCGLPDA